jgi:hypothetical protein
LDEEAGLLLDTLLYATLAHAEVPQRGDGKASELLGTLSVAEHHTCSEHRGRESLESSRDGQQTTPERLQRSRALHGEGGSSEKLGEEPVWRTREQENLGEILIQI